MNWTSYHTELQKTLAELYLDTTSAHRIARQAGIDIGLVNFGNNPKNNWYNFIKEADAQGKLSSLVKEAHNEYKTNIPLKKLYDISKRLEPIDDIEIVKPINVKQLPPNFLDRPNDLQAVIDTLLADEGQATTPTRAKSQIGLHGMGGIGKSVLAAAVARHENVQRHFIGGIFWLTLGTKPKIAQLQSDLAEMLDRQRHVFENVNRGQKFLGELLDKRTCLIVLDDVWHADDVRLLLGDIGPSNRILITTRDASIITALGAREHTIGLLSDSQSRKLLALWAGFDEANLPTEAIEVVRQCGNLPLALAICGAMVRDGMSWKYLLDALINANLKFIEHDQLEQRSVMASLEVSVDNLKKTAAECYKELAVFPPDETIPVTSILTMWAHTHKLEKGDCSRLLVDLDRKSLVRKIKVGKTTLIELHDLQHDYLRAVCKNFLKSLHGLILDAYSQKTIERKWSTGPDDGYFFKHLAYHLKNAGKEKDLISLLLDFDWIETKLQNTDVTGLMQDYDHLQHDSEMLDISRAIRLSAHVLSAYPRHLPSQLIGRLKGSQVLSIQSFLKQIPLRVHYPWLRPLTGSLTPPGGPLIENLQGHSDLISALDLSPEGRRALSGSKDKTLKLWDLEIGKELRTLRGHNAPISALALLPDSLKALSGSWDKTLKLWDLETGQELKTLQGHTDRISSIALSSDGRRALSGSNDKTLKLWDLEIGKELRTLRGHNAPISALALLPNSLKALSGSWDKTLKLWDLETGQELKTLQGHTDRISSIALSSDGRRALSGSNDKTLKLWDLEIGKGLRTLRGHNAPISALALLPDSLKALSGSLDNTLKLWDLETGQELKTLQGHTDRISDIEPSPDGRRALSSSWDRTLRLWDLETGQELKTLQGHTDSVIAGALLPKGRQALSASWDKTLRLWDLETGPELRTLQGHFGPVNALTLLPDGLKALSGSDDNTLRLWDLETGQELRTLQGHSGPVNAFVLLPDGFKALSASWDRTLRLWDLETGRELRTLRGHNAPTSAIALLPDSLKALSGSWDNTLKLWDLETGQELRTLQGHSGRVNALALLPDGLKALSGSDDNTLRLWDLETGRELRTLQGHSGPINALALLPDGRQALSGSGDNTLKLWDLETGRELRTLRGHSGPINALALLPDGRQALSGSGDNTLKLWDLETGQELKTLQGHSGPVNVIALSLDGRLALSGSHDNMLKLWNLEAGKMLADFSGDGQINAIDLSKSKMKMVAGESTGRIHILILENCDI